MKKIEFIAFSDLHANDWKLSYEYTGNRMEDAMKTFREVKRRALELKVPTLFSGDFVHQPRGISNECLDALSIELADIRTPMIGIDGNHDQSRANTHKNISPGYFSAISRMVNGVICVNQKPHIYGMYMVHGIPYMKHNVGFKTYLKKAHKIRKKHPHHKHILLIHTDLPGAMKDNGTIAESVENIKSLKMFKGFGLVLCGHIHKAQVVSSKIVMVGSPYQQSLAEMGDKKGYWEIYDDLSFKFVPIKGIPTYKKYDPAEPPEDFSKHIWVKEAPKPIETSDGVSTQFDIKQGRKSIAKAYLNVNKQKDKRKRKLLINLINKAV